MNDLSFVSLIHLGELTSSLHAVIALLLGVLFFLGYELMAEVGEGQPAAPERSVPLRAWAYDALPTSQLSKGVVIPLLSDTWSEENQQVLEASGLLDQANAFEQENQQIEEAFGLVDQDSSWVLDDDSYWGVWTEADRLAIEALANPPPPLVQILDAHPFKGEADNLNQLTLEELLGGAYPAEDEDIEVWDTPDFWARHI